MSDKIERLQRVMLKNFNQLSNNFNQLSNNFDQLSGNYVTKQDFNTLKTEVTKVSSQLNKMTDSVFCEENSVRNRVSNIEKDIKLFKKVSWVAIPALVGAWIKNWLF